MQIFDTPFYCTPKRVAQSGLAHELMPVLEVSDSRTGQYFGSKCINKVQKCVNSSVFVGRKSSVIPAVSVNSKKNRDSSVFLLKEATKGSEKYFEDEWNPQFCRTHLRAFPLRGGQNGTDR